MAILPVTNEDVEFFTTLINPKRHYSSSSSGVTGSIRLFPRGSSIEKEVKPLANFEDSFVQDQNLEQTRLALASSVKTNPNGSFFASFTSYMQQVNSQSSSAKKRKEIFVNRFTPTPSFTSNTIRKWNVKDILIPFYSLTSPSAGWGYTNYNSLNFFTSPSVLTSSVLLYPSVENPDLPEHIGYVSGSYALSGGFSFDFHINPRYNSDSINTGHFKAGTIFHLSSSYALSLVTGSRKDENGLPTAFRLLLQLSHSADVSPSKATPGSYPSDLIFMSEDNSLLLNNWHRVVVRWGTNIINDGTGSFNIDGVDKGIFCIPSGTIMPRLFGSSDNPKVLCVGNYYEGSNIGTDSLVYFFSDVAAEREGIEQLVDSGGMFDQPNDYQFNHPLKAEAHDLAIRRDYMSDSEILQTSGSGISTADSTKFAFYVPPFFVKTTPVRKNVNGYGGILQTPFFEVDGSTDDPFNVAMAFGVAGHYINLENFVKDFATNVFPRLHHLSGAAIDYTTTAQSANDILYQSKLVRKRNLTVLPCDDGTFEPNFSLLSSEDSTKYIDSLGRIDPSVVNLDNLLSTSSLLMSKTHDAEYDPTWTENLIGFTPENVGVQPGPAYSNYANTASGSVSGAPLTIFQRLKDPSSDQVTFFDISNLYYGSRILPGSFEITDSSLTGSSGAISITLKDDGLGNIYRADANTPPCKWNSVGNIFYNEGVVFIKSPHLYFFGKNQYEMKFKGEQQMHTSKYEILAPNGLLNSSSNPTYARVANAISASLDPTDTDKFVYISNINFHDENLNVVAKAQLAQPVLKREGEKILFKIAFDF